MDSLMLSWSSEDPSSPDSLSCLEDALFLSFFPVLDLLLSTFSSLFEAFFFDSGSLLESVCSLFSDESSEEPRFPGVDRF
jgi:hypothetical protein